jgi:hypothetical protein
MKTFKLYVAAMVATIGLLVSCNSNNNAKDTGPEPKKDAASDKPVPTCGPVIELRSAMRKLWEDHIIWTRNVICNLVDNLPGKDQAVNRLMQNQEDIGNAIKPYYGNDAGEKLTGLLKQHIAISADVVNFAKANKKDSLDAANKRWQANADEITDFLSQANTNWGRADVKKMMDDHLEFTTNEAKMRIKKDYDGDIKAFDKVHNEILSMADMLSEGIMKQFPDKFK